MWIIFIHNRICYTENGGNQNSTDSCNVMENESVTDATKLYVLHGNNIYCVFYSLSSSLYFINDTIDYDFLNVKLHPR